MAPHSFSLCTFLTLTLLLCFHGITDAMKYNCVNDATKFPGGVRFEKEVGVAYTQKLLETVNKFLWNDLFQQTDPKDQKELDSVNCYIVEFDGAEGISWGNNNINVSSIFLKGYEGDLKWKFTSLMYHEICHVFQWDGEGTCPNELVEGIADYAKLKANYAQEGYAVSGQGDRWDQGYDFTARFLEYCDTLVPGFVAKLNKMMRKKYDVKYFKDLTGKPVEQLWKDYKAKYPNAKQPALARRRLRYASHAG